MSSGIRARTSSINIPVAVIPLTPIQELINGLRADGVFAKLDRLWVFAQATQAQALVDIVAGATATAVNSPAFTINVGYVGNGSTQYIDSNFDPTVGAPLYAQDSACFFAWNNTSGANANPWLAGQLTVNGFTDVTPRFTDNNDYWRVNQPVVDETHGGTGESGLYLVNRDAAASSTFDINGIQVDSAPTASVAPTAANFVALRHQSSFGVRQCCCFGFGQSLTAGNRTNLYTRLRTYMTAVGVP